MKGKISVKRPSTYYFPNIIIKTNRMNQYPSVTKFMATKLITFTPETDIGEAIDVILKKKISGAPVLNAKKELVGMLSEVDCLRILLEGPYNKEPEKMTTVADYMSTSVKTISIEKTILDAAYEFVHSGFNAPAGYGPGPIGRPDQPGGRAPGHSENEASYPPRTGFLERPSAGIVESQEIEVF